MGLEPSGPHQGLPWPCEAGVAFFLWWVGHPQILRWARVRVGPSGYFYMVSERVILPRAHVGSHHARFNFEVAKSAPHVNQAQEWSSPVPR
ncbi:hypothetical protein CRG98_022875 [Punica granatum]|uniref:Uncharacterized protein n=1 Tax=Punica granatum TaxID=22663 RepID=A0A2I0JKA1_PUNGR|nr:hypothetical protein CRG98_022875 [Punica granatum]